MCHWQCRGPGCQCQCQPGPGSHGAAVIGASGFSGQGALALNPRSVQGVAQRAHRKIAGPTYEQAHYDVLYPVTKLVKHKKPFLMAHEQWLLIFDIGAGCLTWISRPGPGIKFQVSALWEECQSSLTSISDLATGHHDSLRLTSVSQSQWDHSPRLRCDNTESACSTAVRAVFT
eukprot:3941255-Rhodomonas_salina.1